MHPALLILAVGKSKVPFYIAGGVLVLWALIVSMGIGMRRASFPEGPTQQRVVMAISAVLVVVAAAMAVAVSGGEGKTPTAAAAQGKPAETQPAPEVSKPETTSPQTSNTASSPTPTTVTPATSSAPASSKLSLEADSGGQLAYNAKSLSAKAGTVTITMTNSSPVEHNVTIAEGSKVLGATPTFVGGSKSVTLKLKPGTYTFYCSVPGHRQAGMEGTLTVSS